MDIVKANEIAAEVIKVVNMMKESADISESKYSRREIVQMSVEELQKELELQYYRGVENGIKIIQETLSRMADLKED